ncbi:hypothetical protein BJQ94_09220 [Cryobacterium sp. SO2]|uniref:hypothetical protein n=1 Tax=Cryobacterium sp. SO2 TaxID=1897060 RepID=UPI00223D950D|nr:hypothetical protein [Cryobacterium sp. SO2]WEO79189.1 hypothetical protein BJQ94_09220 [Cryobacterium sp. SO2]
MPLWSWILIWTLLVAGLVGMLAWFAVRLFRKSMRTLAALDELGQQVAELDTGAQLPGTAFRPAVFEDRRALAAAIEQSRVEHSRRRSLRRERSINRGKLLQHTPYKPEDRPPC